MSLSFVKMHGAGNDYVYVDATRQSLPGDLPELARRISDRHFGVGADGLICILPPEPGAGAHVRMRMWNSDGSESEMCGNGIRCVGKLAWDDAIARHNPLKVQTGRGVLNIELQVGADGKVHAATVDMGEPILDLEKIGVLLRPGSSLEGTAQTGSRSRDHTWSRSDAEPMLSTASLSGEAVARERPGENRHVIDTKHGPREATFVSMGNPHAVLFVEDLSAVDLPAEGREIEHLPIFPRRTNVHFVQVLSPGDVKVLHWERGTGATLACGTGACAVCVAGALTGRTARQIIAHVPGGQLKLLWDPQTNHVFKTGEAVEVFRGVWRG